MLINIEVNNNVEICSLNDLFILGRLQEVGSIKVNNQKSQENLASIVELSVNILMVTQKVMSGKEKVKLINIMMLLIFSVLE